VKLIEEKMKDKKPQQKLEDQPEGSVSSGALSPAVDNDITDEDSKKEKKDDAEKKEVVQTLVAPFKSSIKISTKYCI